MLSRIVEVVGVEREMREFAVCRRDTGKRVMEKF